MTYNDLNGAEAKEILMDWFKQLLDSRPELQRHLTLPNADITLNVNIGVDMYIGGTVPVESAPDHLDMNGSVVLVNTRRDATVDGGSGVTAERRGAQPASQHKQIDLSTRVNAAPIPGGSPPDQIREQHDLPISRPAYGPRETGSHLFLADIPDDSETGGREGIVAPGYVFAREPVTPVTVRDETDSLQVIPVDRGAIQVETGSRGIDHAGVHVSAGTHYSSVKEQGDQAGKPYSSVNGVYDAGPAGLMRHQSSGGAGMYGDGRSRISFGNNQRG